MRILLTGAGGLIGQAMARTLAADRTLITLGRSGQSDVAGDLNRPETLVDLGGRQVDCLVHCAGVVDEDFRDDPRAAFVHGTVGADRLVRLALDAGARRLVYVSSVHVYGPLVGHIDERVPANPVSNYAIGHYATEQIFRRQAEADVSVLILRPCAVFGSLQNPAAFRRWSLIPFSFPRQIIESGRITIQSSGLQRRNFVGAADIAAATRAWLGETVPRLTYLNPLGEYAASVYDFALKCAAIADGIVAAPHIVSRQESTGRTAGDDFVFASIHPQNGTRQSLDTHLREIMRMSVQTARENVS
jgi:UDP-glucose 4-epimerase